MASPGCSPLKGKGVRTGGRLHPGLAGERLLNNATAGLSRSGHLGFVLELACGVAYGFALGSTFHEFDKR